MDPYPLEIDNPLATCGHCNFATTLTGKWSVEDGRLVFRAALNPLTRRGPGLESCSESDPVVHFGQILVDGEPLTEAQADELIRAAESREAWDEELGEDEFPPGPHAASV